MCHRLRASLAGETRHFELRMVSCDDDKVLSIVRDVTERRRAERALLDNEAAVQATNEEIRNLGGRLIAAQEDERRRIARELHDDLSQKLALLTMELDQLSQTPSNGETSQRLHRLTDQAGQIATDVTPTVVSASSIEAGSLGSRCLHSKLLPGYRASARRRGRIHTYRRACDDSG